MLKWIISLLLVVGIFFGCIFLGEEIYNKNNAKYIMTFGYSNPKLKEIETKDYWITIIDSNEEFKTINIDSIFKQEQNKYFTSYKLKISFKYFENYKQANDFYHALSNYYLEKSDVSYVDVDLKVEDDLDTYAIAINISAFASIFAYVLNTEVLNKNKKVERKEDNKNDRYYE